MAKETEATAFEPLFSAVQTIPQAPEITSSDLRAQCEEASSAVPEPKSAKALAALYGVSDRTLQDWFKTICTAYLWLPLTDLKSGNSNKTRYTVLCQDLIAQYREAAKDLSADAWIKSIRAAHSEQGAFPEPEVTEAAFVEAPFEHESDMVPYQPQDGELERFTPPARKLRRFVSTEAFVNTAKQHTETALDVTQSNSASLTTALVNQMEQEGQRLGLTLFQAKYGTAQSVMADLEETLAKKSGLVEDTPPPPVGSC